MWHRANVPAMLGAMVAAATDAGYVVLILRQGPPYDWERVAFVACVILAAGALVLAGALARHVPLSHRLLVAGAVLLFGLSIVGIFSIGSLLLVAAMLTLWGVVRADREAGNV